VDNHHGTAGPVVVVASALVVVGPVVVGWVLVVVASVVVDAAVVVGTVVVGATVVVEPVIGGWVVVTPKVENASVIVVVPAVAGACAVTGPGALVALLAAGGTAFGVGAERVGAVAGPWGPVGGVGAGLGVGSAGTVGSARPGARRDGWGSRVAEATRAARTAVVSPKATSPSLQGHRDAGKCRGRDLRGCRGCDLRRCWGAWGRHGQRPGSTSVKADTARPTGMTAGWSYPVTPLAAFALGSGFDRWDAINAPNRGRPA
jgi:hypothetical protein